MKTLILGMGNPILSDDGVGLFVARSLRGKIEGADVVTTTMVGLSLFDIICGYENIFLIDALVTKEKSTGKVKKLREGEGTLHLFSSHGLNFWDLLQLGKMLGYEMPEVGGVYGIEIGDQVSFGEGLSPELRQKTESIVNLIVEDIRASLKA